MQACHLPVDACDESITLGPAEQRGLSGIESFFISLAFWITLLVAGGLSAAFALTPGLQELSRLEQQSGKLQQQLNARQHEVAHLQKVAAAMQSDSAFLARVANSEFAMQRRGTTEIRVADELGYDARVPVVKAAQQRDVSSPYASVIDRLATDAQTRRNLLWSAMALFAVAFLILNESFFSGHIGRRILHVLASLCQRYRVRATNLD